MAVDDVHLCPCRLWETTVPGAHVTAHEKYVRWMDDEAAVHAKVVVWVQQLCCQLRTCVRA